MKATSARETKNGFRLMIGNARAKPWLIEKHGRAVVVVSIWNHFSCFLFGLGERTRGNVG